VVESDPTDPDRGLRVGFLRFEPAFDFSARKPLPVHDDPGLLLEFVEQLLGERLLERRVCAYTLLSEGHRDTEQKNKTNNHHTFHGNLL